MPAVGGFRSEVIDEIKRCCEQEVKDPPVPRKYEDIPISYESITNEWLTATLGRDASGTVVRSFKLGPKDDGSANRRRIEIEWEGPQAHELPKSVFCKAAHSLQNRIILSVGGTYSETAFYNDIRPKIDFEAPWAYYAGYNPKSWAAIIMLRDMADSTTFCNHKTQLSKEQFFEQVTILAQLHGKFYESKEPFFGNLIAYKQRFQNLHDVGVEEACRNGFRAAKSVIPPRLFAREDEVWPATVKSVDRNFSLPPTVVHGDVHLGNWYITSDGHMGLTDWQAMARGHWSRDLAYALGTAVPTEKRRQWEHDAVRLYAEELAKAGGPKTTEEEAWLELRRQSLGALFYWTLTLTPSKSMPDMQPEAATLDFLQRITALMDDHNVLDAFDF